METNPTFISVGTPSYPDAVLIIDRADLPLVWDGGPQWVAARTKKNGALYAVRGVGPRKARRFELLHRKLLGVTDPAIKIDHRNGNGLDNRRENLRLSTNQQNSRNGRAHRDGSSKYRGVSWDKARGKWAAGIGIDGTRRALGRFDEEIAAARAYDAAALAEFGEFARLNFPR